MKDRISRIKDELHECFAALDQSVILNLFQDPLAYREFKKEVFEGVPKQVRHDVLIIDNQYSKCSYFLSTN